MKLLNIIITLLIGFGFCESKSQNLITNGSFENYVTPANWTNYAGGYSDYSVNPFKKILNNWECYNSPDYFCTNNPYNYVSTPINHFGNQYAKNGGSYVGFATYGENTQIKEYSYQQLQQPLQAGHNYNLSFWVSLSDKFTYAVSKIGAYFCNTLPTDSNNYINATPQVINNNGFITDTIGWQQIQGSFIANGGEQYIIFGKFGLTGTDTLYVGTNNPINGTVGESYYFLDDISLVENTNVGIVEQSNKSEVFSLWPNPAQEILNVDCRLLNEATIIKIVDVVGREIFEQQYSKEIDVSSLEKGIYFIEIHNKEKLIGTKKFVKQ